MKTFSSKWALSSSNFLRFSSKAWISLSSSSFSLSLPNRCARLPPLISPRGVTISPSRVTTLISPFDFLPISKAISRFSTTKTSPKRYSTIGRYCASHLTRREARPITPFSFTKEERFNPSLGLIASKGRKVALPRFLPFRYSMASRALFRSRVMILWILSPKAASIALSYWEGVLIKSITTPSMPDNLSRARRISSTPL